MNLKDMIVFLRESVLDDTGGGTLDYLEITKDSEQALLLRWSNEELIQFINQAINEACRNSLLLYDDEYSIKTVLPSDPDPEKVKELGYTLDPSTGIVTDSSGNVIDPVTAGVNYGKKNKYELPKEILRVERVYDETNKRWLEPVDLFSLQDGYDQEGAPRYYSVNYAPNALYLKPYPTEARITLKLFVYRLPKEPLKKFKDVSEIPEVFHIPVLWYAAFLAYSKDEPNTLDTTRALQFKQQFDAYFGRNSAYSDMRKKRHKRKTIRYRDLM